MALVTVSIPSPLLPPSSVRLSVPTCVCVCVSLWGWDSGSLVVYFWARVRPAPFGRTVLPRRRRSMDSDTLRVSPALEAGEAVSIHDSNDLGGQVSDVDV